MGLLGSLLGNTCLYAWYAIREAIGHDFDVLWADADRHTERKISQKRKKDKKGHRNLSKKRGCLTPWPSDTKTSPGACPLPAAPTRAPSCTPRPRASGSGCFHS